MNLNQLERKMLDTEILMAFAVSLENENRYHKPPKTLELAMFDEEINNFLIKHDVQLSPQDLLKSQCALGLISVAIKLGAHEIGGHTIASAIGKLTKKYKIGFYRFQRWLKSDELFKFYDSAVELIKFISVHKLKINALTIIDDVYMKQSQIDGDDYSKKTVDRFFVRECIYQSQVFPFDENRITPKMILSCRQEAGLTQKQAANIVYVDERTWQRWESGTREMSKGNFELFLIKAGLLP